MVQILPSPDGTGQPAWRKEEGKGGEQPVAQCEQNRQSRCVREESSRYSKNG